MQLGWWFGVFASQFMSIIVAKLFEADMSEFHFVFSQGACIQTCICFAVMYIAVMFFNTLTVSRYKLINLLNANKKNEKIKIKNPFLSILIFLVGASVLGIAYYKVTAGFSSLSTGDKLLCVFWSLSGFILGLVQKCKSIYLKNANMFVLRQINNKINTMVVSMSVICLMLFMTITILSSALALRNTMQKDLIEMTPVDLNLYKTANLPEKYMKYGKEITTTEVQRADSKITIKETLVKNGFDMNKLKDVVEVPIYTANNITLGESLGDSIDEVKVMFPFLQYDMAETIMKVSDYNKIARLYGICEYTLNNDEYIVLCNYDSITNLRNKGLEIGNVLEIAGENYRPKYNKCQDGFIEMSTSHTNAGIILVPDSCNLKDENREKQILAANYNDETDEGKEEIEKEFVDGSTLVKKLTEQGINIDGQTKITIIQSSVGLATIITFIAIYLGIIFLIASSAILALKQLTDSSDNRQRYLILRKIGCDEKMINKALFRQIGIFFMAPLVLAVIHSVFGVQFGINAMAGLASSEDLIPSVVATIVLMIGIYGTYFLATYLGSKNIIKE